MGDDGLLPATITPMVAHIKSNLERHRSTITTMPYSPLFVAFQGPQGSGKTFLTSKLRAELSSPAHGLSIAVLSIDDLYLPHSGLVDVAAAHPENHLLSGRGPPGTHDIPLGSKLLQELKSINESGKENTVVRFPAFEKSLFGGEGDRIEEGVVVRPPLDIVILEGWCVGFCPVDENEVNRRYEIPITDLQGTLDLQSFKKENILEINANLWNYVEWWKFFDCFIQVKPPDETPYSLIYKWRLQQEHNMKAKNGGRGMTDEEVKKFVDRYIPCYIYFSDGIQQGYVDDTGLRILPKWNGNSLKVEINVNRDLLGVKRF